MTRQRDLRVGAARTCALALVLLLGLSLLPGTAGAHRAQRHPEDEGKGNSRHLPFDEHADYSRSSGVQVVGHHLTPDGFNADVWAHGRYAYLASWGSGAGNLDPETGELTGEAPFCPSQGVRVFDLLDPSNPRLVSTFADAADGHGLDGSWTEKVVVRDVRTEGFTGTLAAVSAQTCDRQPRPEGEPAPLGGFALYDVTDPTDPRLLSTQRTIASVGSHEIFLEIREGADGGPGEAYVYTTEILQEEVTSQDPELDVVPDLRIFDVGDPTDPRWVGDWGVLQNEGTQPVSPDEDGFTRSRFVHSVIVSEEVAYLSYWDRGTVLLDVSNPAAPLFLGSVDVPTAGRHSQGNLHSSWLAKGGDLLIETAEVFDPRPQVELDENGQVVRESDQEHAFGYPRFTDIRDPANPRIIGYVELDRTRAPLETLPPGDWTVHDPKVRPGLPGEEDQAYFSWYSEGVVVTGLPEVTETLDETRTAVTAQFVPPPRDDPWAFFQGEGVEFPYVWGVFLVEDVAGRGRYALASDINSGLWVFRLDEEVPGDSCEGERRAEEFDDVGEGNVHLDAITCALNAGITQGTSAQPPRYSPGLAVTRGQMASFVVRTLDTAGFGPPPAPAQAQFTDVAGHAHEDAINRLAAVGVIAGRPDGTFRPQDRVRRDQTAALLIRAYQLAVQDAITAAAGPHFDDTTGNVHAADVDAARELELVLGVGERRFAPAAQTRRDQMASVLTRLLRQLELTGSWSPAASG